MPALQRLNRFARLVLAWFVLSLGVAVAAPVVQPRVLELVCSGGSMQLRAHGDDGAPAARAALDCPLCATAAALPPPAAEAGLLPPAPLRSLAWRALPSPVAVAIALPPARAPPATGR